MSPPNDIYISNLYSCTTMSTFIFPGNAFTSAVKVCVSNNKEKYIDNTKN